jgi:hypothetical protein
MFNKNGTNLYTYDESSDYEDELRINEHEYDTQSETIDADVLETKSNEHCYYKRKVGSPRDQIPVEDRRRLVEHISSLEAGEKAFEMLPCEDDKGR